MDRSSLEPTNWLIANLLCPHADARQPLVYGYLLTGEVAPAGCSVQEFVQAVRSEDPSTKLHKAPDVLPHAGEGRQPKRGLAQSSVCKQVACLCKNTLVWQWQHRVAGTTSSCPAASFRGQIHKTAQLVLGSSVCGAPNCCSQHVPHNTQRYCRFVDCRRDGTTCGAATAAAADGRAQWAAPRAPAAGRYP